MLRSETAFVKRMLESLTYPDCNLLTRQTLGFHLPVEVPEVLIACRPHEIDSEAIFVIGNNGVVYDAAGNNQVCDGRRSTSEMPVRQELVKRTAERVRWTQHSCNPADALTNFRGAHTEPLMSRVGGARHTTTRLKRTAAVGHLSDVLELLEVGGWVDGARERRGEGVAPW